MNKIKYQSVQSQKIAKIGTVAVCAAALLASGVALASNIHFLAFDVDIGADEVDVTGTLAGLGNKRITITADLTVNVDATCTPPGNSNKQPFGINKKLEVEQQRTVNPKDFDDNGNLDFSFVFDLDFDSLVKCPNNNWEQETDVEVLAVNVDVVQQGGNDSASCELDCTSNPCDLVCVD